ncbi:MAG: LacI family DNA-binding transcriptional regulator [Planctomycetota bacterium]
MPTIKEIAKLAGVSHVTVSKVLAGDTPVTRPAAIRRAEKIRRIAEELGYRPNYTAQSLRSGKTGLIAVLGNTPLSFDDHNQEEAAILRLVARKLRSQHLNLSAQLCDRAEKNCTLPPWKVDAAILVSADSPDQVDDVEAAGIPYVAMNGECGPNGSAVQFDDEAAMDLALDKLFELGHRRIAYLPNFQTFEHRSVFIRERRHRTYLTEHDLPLPTTIAQGDVDELSLSSLLQKWTAEEGVTAVVCWDPWAALYLYQACGRVGLSLPNDLSVITFNDTPLGSEALVPRLSAVARAVQQTADAVVELLDERMSGEHTLPRNIVLQSRLLSRESIAPPRPSP